MRACAVSYARKSPCTIAAANAGACWNAKLNPSPVTASTDPEASPTSATRPCDTRRKRRDADTAPRSVEDSEAPLNRAANPGNFTTASSNRNRRSRESTATPTSFQPTGVT